MLLLREQDYQGWTKQIRYQWREFFLPLSNIEIILKKNCLKLYCVVQNFIHQSNRRQKLKTSLKIIHSCSMCIKEPYYGKAN